MRDKTFVGDSPEFKRPKFRQLLWLPVPAYDPLINPCQTSTARLAGPAYTDRRELAWDAMEPEIRRRVEDEFAREWNAAGIVRRWFLRRKIDAEIARRLTERAPPDALY